MSTLKSHLLPSYQLLNLTVAVQQAVMFDFIMQNKAGGLTHHLLYETARDHLTARISFLPKKDRGEKNPNAQSKLLTKEQGLV